MARGRSVSGMVLAVMLLSACAPAAVPTSGPTSGSPEPTVPATPAATISATASPPATVVPTEASIDPRVVVETFYTWYLADRTQAELLARPDLSEDFRTFITEFAGPYNPVSCGQDVPIAIKAPTVDYEGAGTTEIAVVHTIYVWDATTEIAGPDIRLLRGGVTGWVIDEVLCES